MLSVTRTILVSAPRERVSEYLRDLSRLSQYEPKVDECKVTYPDQTTAVADVSGRWLGLRWKGQLQMRFTRDGGFQSELVRGPIKKMLGGFHLRSVAGGTQLTHVESYALPLPLRLLTPVVRRYVSRTMEKELGKIKEEAERLNRLRVLQDIDRDVQLT